MKKNNKIKPLNKLTISRSGAILSVPMIIVLALIPFIAMVLCDLFKISDSELAIRPLMKIAFVVLVCYAFISAYRKNLTADKALILIILAGIIFRTGYMLYTPWNVRSHDLGSLSPNGGGHATYIFAHVLQGHLPPENHDQFYQPPLYYILSAIVIKIVGLFKGTTDYAPLIKYAVTVSCAASCIALIFVQKIMDLLSVSRKHQIPAMAIIAFFPNFMLMGGRISNDSLATMFMVLTVYFTVRWYYNTNTKNIIFIALSISLGMMSKVSCGTLAVFTGPIMLYKLYLAYKDKKLLPIIKQLAVFAVICFPLALWYPIRNYIKFDQPLNYVYRLRDDADVYTGNISIFKRFFALPLFEEFKQQFSIPVDDYNIFMIITRTSIFGEFKYQVSKIVSILFYYINLLMIIMSLVSMVLVCIKDKAHDMFSKLSMAAVWVVNFGSYIIFNITYPFACTGDFRYIPLTTITGAIYISKAFEMYSGNKSAAVRRTVKVCGGIVAAFCVMSLIMYA